MDAPVQIEPYNPAWAELFLVERDLLAKVLEPWLVGRIEHVGSTAVPGLSAKPVIDIMAPVRDLDSSRAALAALQAVGYCYAPYKAEVEHWLCKPSPEHRTHHLHLVPHNSKLWIECLAFRDLLTSDASVAESYAALKHRLAAAHRNDRERYTQEKGPFIESAIRATVPTIHAFVLVEGESDAAAVRALAHLVGCDLGRHHIQIHSASGVTNFSRALADFKRTHPSADLCGMYDVADERHVRRALANSGIPISADESLETFGFFACVDDLEDELIRALGAEGVEGVLDAQGELDSFRRFQAMPQHRSSPVHHQLRRFLGTRATRKIRSAQRLVEALDFARLPHPLMQLAARLEAASRTAARSDT